MIKDDLISISALDFSDINHSILILGQIISNKDLTTDEFQRLKYALKTYEQANLSICKTLSSPI